MGWFLRGFGFGLPAVLALVSLLRFVTDSGAAAEDVEGVEDAETGADETVDPASAPETAGTEAVTTSETGATVSADELEALKTSLTANGDLIPELVTGNTVAELLASVETAKSAYQATADRINAGISVPAGSGDRSQPPDGWESMSAAAKIAEGVRRRATL